ncbi:MAG: hypothetical protein RL344_604 [Pseudomonadota bacterium]|jgi:hypothetical protein
MNKPPQLPIQPFIATKSPQKKLILHKSQKTLAIALIVSVLFHLLGAGLINWRGIQSASLSKSVGTDFILEAQLLLPQSPKISQQKINLPSPPVQTPKTVKTVKTLIKTAPLVIPRNIKLPPVVKTSAADASLANLTNSLPLILPPKPVETPTDTAETPTETVSDVVSDVLLPTDKELPSTEEKSTEVPQKQALNTNRPLNSDEKNPTSNLPTHSVIQPSPNNLSYNSYKLPYQLPENVQARYDTYTQDEASNSVKKQLTTFQFKYLKHINALNNENSDKTESKDPYDIFHTYETELKTLSNNTDTQTDLRYSVTGNLTVYDLRPTRIEESTAKKSMVATTIDHYIKRAVISSQEGFVAYDDTRQDLLSIIIQLGINQQLEPRWFVAGTTQDFKVYRPTGLTTWRFQSQGIETVKIGEKSLNLLYLKRVPLDDQLDYEEEQHLWLDPKRYGFPVKMRFTRQNGQYTEFILSDWKE